MTADEASDLSLTVYFDRSCDFCARGARWLEREPKYVPVHCVAAQSATRADCALSPDELLREVTVIASDGAVYHGTKAFLICLWALRRYRKWSMRLSTKAMLPWARRLFGMVARFGNVARIDAAGRSQDRQR